MNIVRMSADGLTREEWDFDWCVVHSGEPARWVCTWYDRAVRAKKTHKTWTLAATTDAPGYRWRWAWTTSKDAKTLPEAPIDDALIAEVRRRAAEAPVVGRRA